MDIMNNNLGEIFYNGKIINLNGTTEQELKMIFDEIENSQAKKKEIINNIFKQMVTEAQNG